MTKAIVANKDGKTHILLLQNVKTVEVVPAEPGVPAEPASEAVEAHPGTPADKNGLGGTPPIKAQAARKASPGTPAVPEHVVVDGFKLGYTAAQFVELLNTSRS